MKRFGWLAKLFCNHDWELLEEHREPGPASAAGWGVSHLPYHRVQTYRCRKCRVTKYEEIP